MRSRVPRSRGRVRPPTVSTRSRRVLFPVSGSTPVTETASLPSTPVSPVLTSGSPTTETASTGMIAVSSPSCSVVVRSRASRSRGRVRHPPVSAGSRRVGPRVSGSASVTTYAFLTSFPVSQTVVVSALPLPSASSSVPMTSSPPILVDTTADPVKPAKKRESSRLPASPSAKRPGRHFHLYLVPLGIRLCPKRCRLVDRASLLLGSVKRLRPLSPLQSLLLWCRHYLPRCV